MSAARMSRMDFETETVYQPIYDTVYLPEALAGNRAHAFIYALGMSIPVKHGSKVKTYEDTNLLQQAMLDAPKSFLIESIDAYFVDDQGIIPANSRWYAETTIDFTLSMKVYWSSPLAKCVSTVGLFETGALTREELEERKREFQSKLELPVAIGRQQNFGVLLHFSEWCMARWADRSSPSKLCVFLNGMMTRPVM
jgi:hypothetical protein